MTVVALYRGKPGSHNAMAVDTVAPAREEDEEVAAERVVLEHVAHDHHQAVGPLASVDGLRRDEHANARRKAQHSSVSTRARSASINRGRHTQRPTYPQDDLDALGLAHRELDERRSGREALSPIPNALHVEALAGRERGDR